MLAVDSGFLNKELTAPVLAFRSVSGQSLVQLGYPGVGYLIWVSYINVKGSIT